MNANAVNFDVQNQLRPLPKAFNKKKFVLSYNVVNNPILSEIQNLSKKQCLGKNPWPEIQKINSWMISAETATFMKWGGLGMIASELPEVFNHVFGKNGEQLSVVTPMYLGDTKKKKAAFEGDVYTGTENKKIQLKKIRVITVPFAADRPALHKFKVTVYTGVFNNTNYIFLANDRFFSINPHPDNPSAQDGCYVMNEFGINEVERFAFFSKAVYELLKEIFEGKIKDISRPNVLIANDWHSGALSGLTKYFTKAQIEAQNGTKKQTASNDKTRKKSDKNVENYRKIVVADNDSEDDRYKTDYRGRVQDKNVTILPQPMFALNYYERPEEVKRQVNYYKGIDDLNARRVLPHRLLITNNEASLSEEQVKQHFASIDEQTAAIVKESGNVLHYYARALDFYLVQDFDNALKDLDEAIRCDSTFFPAYFSRALIYYKQLEYRKRDRKFEVETVEEQNLQVRSYDYNKVREDLDRVIELAPDFVYAYYNRGNILAVMKDYRAALVDYNKAIELDPRFADAYYNRGLTNIFLGNNRQGIQDLSKAGELGIFSAYNIIKRFTTIEEK